MKLSLRSKPKYKKLIQKSKAGFADTAPVFLCLQERSAPISERFRMRYFKFPSFHPRSKSIVVLKNTKGDGGSDRNCYLPEVVYDKLMRMREMQEALKNELGSDYYSDYGMIICQENGNPVMTEHLNRRFQRVLDEMGIKPKRGQDQYVFHSIRSTATTYKLRMPRGDIKAVQGENGQKDPKMVTHQYSRIIDEDRIRLADAVNDDFYRKEEKRSEEVEMLSAVQNNPELFKQFMAFMTMADSAKKNEKNSHG